MDEESLERMRHLNALIRHHTTLLNDHIRDSTLAVSDLEEDLRYVFSFPSDGHYVEWILSRFNSSIRQMIRVFSRLSEHIRHYRFVTRSISDQMDKITRRP